MQIMIDKSKTKQQYTKKRPSTIYRPNTPILTEYYGHVHWDKFNLALNTTSV